MDLSKKSAVAGLPDDLLVEILARIPVKDLDRSKCVSRDWRNIITDPIDRKKLLQTLLRFFYGCGDGDEDDGSGAGDGGADSDGCDEDDDNDWFGYVAGASDEGDKEEYRTATSTPATRRNMTTAMKPTRTRTRLANTEDMDISSTCLGDPLLSSTLPSPF